MAAPFDIHVVTANAGTNGSINPSGNRPTLEGMRLEFTVTPDALHGISSVTGCNGTLSGNRYTTGPIFFNLSG